MTPPKPPLTHFLCIPLITPLSRPQLSASIAALRADVAAPDPLGGPTTLLTPDAVRPPGTLHLTLGVMSFHKNEEGLNRAIELLRGLRPREVLRDAVVAEEAAGGGIGMGLRAVGTATTMAAPTPADDAATVVTEATLTPSTTEEQQQPPPTFSISLRGLRTMGNNPTKASILYSPPADDLGILQRFSESVRATFTSANLVVDEGRPLILHATLINTIYVKDKGNNSQGKGKKGGRWGKKLVIDATALIDRYEDRVWLEDLPLDRLAICKMGSKTVVRDGEQDAEYEVEAEIEF